MSTRNCEAINNWEIIEILHETSNGCIYLVRNRDTEEIAVKRILKNYINMSLMQLKGLSNANIPQIYNVQYTDTDTIVIEEFIKGKTLEKMITDRGRMSKKLVIDIMIDLCCTLTFIHTQKPPIIHRDIKPSNIMLTPECKVKLIDFGAARQYAKGAGQDTEFIGTTSFASPEQYGFGQSDARSDIYSCGVLLRVMLTGSLDGTLTNKAINSIISKCTKMDPSNRFQTAEDLKTELTKLIKIKNKRKKIMPVVGAVLALVIGLSSWLILGNKGNKSRENIIDITFNETSQVITEEIHQSTTQSNTETSDTLSETSSSELASVANVQGNTLGNIANEGIAAIKDDYIYYSKATSGSKTDGKLYCIKTDNSGKKVLCDDLARYINVVGDWIYYSNYTDNSKLYCIKTDGKGRQKLSEESVFNINIVEDWIYYTNGNPPNWLCRIKMNGTENQELRSSYSDNINVIGNDIYFNTHKGISTIKTDGSGEKNLGDNIDFQLINCINVVGDWIYFSKEGNIGELYRMKTDGRSIKKLDKDLVALSFNVVGDYIYYGSTNTGEFTGKKLYRIKTDGSGKQKLSDCSVATDINVVGNWIYYISSSGEMYRMKTDGSQNQIVPD